MHSLSREKMKMAVVHFVLLVIICASAQPHQTAVDHVELVLTWPAGFCMVDPCKSRNTDYPAKFLIHGAWPQAAGGIELIKCTDAEFSKSQMKDLIPKINDPWQSLAFDNDVLWKHEWTDHGTCSGFTVKEYFELTYKAYLKHPNLLSALSKANIRMGNEYSASEYVNAVKAETKYVPVIKCRDAKLAKGGTQQVLYEIALCMDKTFASFQDCTYKPIRCDSRNKVLLKNNGRMPVSYNP